MIVETVVKPVSTQIVQIAQVWLMYDPPPVSFGLNPTKKMTFHSGTNYQQYLALFF
jgi:hypothetical protein